MSKWIWIVLAILVALSGCELFSRDFYLTETDFPDKNAGMLVMLLDGSSIATKTIAPADMVVAKYNLTFTHTTAPANNFTEVDWPAAAVYSKNGLAPGNWTVAAVAKDSTGFQIGAISGVVAQTAPFTITAGQITGPVALNIIPIIGTGDLSLTLTWPVGAATTPVTMTTYLVPAGATGPVTDHPITFIINEASRNATCSLTAKNAGYYTLQTQLFGAGTLVWGWVDSVRIVNGKNASGTLTLTSGTGGLTLQVTSDMQNPITINWNATPPASITVGQSITVTAQPVPTTPTAGYAYNYQWYLDGVSLGTGYQTAGITYGSTLAPRDYGLCVVVTEKQTASPFGIRTISSKGFNFNVH